MGREFLREKSQLFLCLEDLQNKVEFCVAKGMDDEFSHFYNAVLDWKNAVEYASSTSELVSILNQAQSLEHNLDSWMSRHGLETLSLNWPKLT